MWCVRQASLPAVFHAVQQVAEPLLEVGKRLDPIPLSVGQSLVGKIVIDDAVPDEVDQRVRLGIDVVAVEQHGGEAKDIRQAPRERRHIVRQGPDASEAC